MRSRRRKPRGCGDAPRHRHPERKWVLTSRNWPSLDCEIGGGDLVCLQAGRGLDCRREEASRSCLKSVYTGLKACGKLQSVLCLSGLCDDMRGCDIEHSSSLRTLRSATGTNHGLGVLDCHVLHLPQHSIRVRRRFYKHLLKPVSILRLSTLVIWLYLFLLAHSSPSSSHGA